MSPSLKRVLPALVIAAAVGGVWLGIQLFAAIS
jgi:hypothetical protein